MGSLLPVNGVDSNPPASMHSSKVLYTIKKDPVVGRYMVASRDIQPGEEIFTDDPAAIGPDNASKPLCLGCMTKVNGSFLCRGCNWPMCSETCSKASNHYDECKLLKARGAKVKVPWFDKACSFYDAILPLRVLILKKVNPIAYNLVNILMDHNEDLDESTRRRRQSVVDFLRITCKLKDDFSEDEVHHVLGILSVNSFVIQDGGTDEAHTDLIGLYPWTSIMSHNCSANTKITTRDNFSYACEATVFIQAGEEIVTNYHHYHYQLYGTSYRRNDLKSTWSFDCACKRCADPTEMGTMISAVNCDSCKFGHLLPKDPLDYVSQWSCDHCGGSVEAGVVEDRIKKFEDEIDNVTSGDAESYEKLLRRMRYYLHENHYWILDVKRRLIDIYGHNEGYLLHKLPRPLLERKIDYCEQLLSIAEKVCPGPSEMRGYLLWELLTVRLRTTQLDWIHMKITTPVHLDQLRSIEGGLREVISIFGKIRLKADEGQIGLKARNELIEIRKLTNQLCKVSSSLRCSGAEEKTASLIKAGGGSLQVLNARTDLKNTMSSDSRSFLAT